MKKYLPIFAGSLIVTFLGTWLGVAIAFHSQRSAVEQNIATLGAVNYGPNRATTTDSTWNIPAAIVGGTKVLKGSAGLFSGICITNETAGAINFYDATSTTHPDYATTTVFKVYANMAEGCYMPDISFSRGLIAEFQSSNVASATIMTQ